MVGRKPSPLMPKRKKTKLRSHTDSRPKKASTVEEDEEISTPPNPTPKGAQAPCASRDPSLCPAGAVIHRG